MMLKTRGPGVKRMDPAGVVGAHAAGLACWPGIRAPADGPALAQPSKGCYGSRLSQGKD